MKKSIITLVFICLWSIVEVNAQQKEIVKQFTQYTEALRQKDFDTSLDYMPEEFFDLIPKEQMVATMKSVFNDPEMSLSFVDFKIDSVDSIRKIKGKNYALLKYSSTMTLKLNEADVDTATTNIILNSYHTVFGKENVKYNAANQEYTIHTTKNVYAISDTELKTWKFIEVDKTQIDLLKTFIPEELLTEPE